MRPRRFSEAAQRFADRREREDNAPRLRAQIPQLESLRLEIEERRAGSSVADTRHIRRIVVESAPALFDLVCGDPSCRDGGHDVTRAVLQALSRGSTQFEGEDTCHGTIGNNAPCSRVLRFVAHATYT